MDTANPTNIGRALAALRKSIPTVCTECGKEFMAQEARTGRETGNRFCSNACRCAFHHAKRREESKNK